MNFNEQYCAAWGLYGEFMFLDLATVHPHDQKAGCAVYHQDMPQEPSPCQFQGCGCCDTDSMAGDRPDYTPEQASEVVAWLNGRDQPLEYQVPRHLDPNDPAVKFPRRPNARRI
jgi:hypothetical protein